MNEFQNQFSSLLTHCSVAGNGNQMLILDLTGTPSLSPEAILLTYTYAYMFISSTK